MTASTRSHAEQKEGALGILAGGGSLPIEIATHVRDRIGRPVHVVALDGEADADFTGLPHTRVNWGQIGRMVRTLRQHGCTRLVLAGTVRRPNLRTLRPDLGLLLALPRLLRTLHGGDDSVLRRVIAYFESKGFEVVGLADVAPHLLAPTGAFGACQPTPRQTRAIDRGLALLGTLGPFDVGQAVVATADDILAIEGAGGTDAMLAGLSRAADAQPGDAARRDDAVLVKWPKPGQELRLDLPAVGPRTIELARGCGIRGIAVESKAAVLLERDVLRRDADAAGVFVLGLARPSTVPQPEATPPSAEPPRGAQLHMRTRRIPGLDERRDVVLGRDLLAALEPHGVGGCAVVTRQYVLAVAARETTLDVLARAAGLRQWGRRKRRAGTLVVRETSPAPGWLTDSAALDHFLSAMDAARVVGLVILTPGLTKDALEPLVARLDASRRFLVTSEPAESAT